jgi:hypothetical protein
MTLSAYKILAFAFASMATSLSWGVNPHDEYYAEDIFTAIEEAKKRPHHYDYSRAKRYNRTTTQSLDIPRLLNKEMGSASIDSRNATSITAADTPLSNQGQTTYEILEDDATKSRSIPINTVTPAIDNPNVQSPNITTNIIAR